MGLRQRRDLHAARLRPGAAHQPPAAPLPPQSLPGRPDHAARRVRASGSCRPSSGCWRSRRSTSWLAGWSGIARPRSCGVPADGEPAARRSTPSSPATGRWCSCCARSTPTRSTSVCASGTAARSLSASSRRSWPRSRIRRRSCCWAARCSGSGSATCGPGTSPRCGRDRRFAVVSSSPVVVVAAIVVRFVPILQAGSPSTTRTRAADSSCCARPPRILKQLRLPAGVHRGPDDTDRARRGRRGLPDLRSTATGSSACSWRAS